MTDLNEAIRSIVAREVAAAEARILAALPSHMANRTMGVKEMAEMLGLSEALIYRMCERQIIPHERYGIPGSKKPAIRFRVGDVEAWREKQMFGKMEAAQ